MTELPFHKRFNIGIDIREAQRRFVNRVKNHIFDNLFQHDVEENIVRGHVLWQIANDLGEEYEWNSWFDDYVEDDFEKCLHALESSYSGLKSQKHQVELEGLINDVIGLSEIDLGIEWRKGVFLPRGATLLDKALVNDNLDWLVGSKFKNVYKPFEKALRHFLESNKRPELGFDVVTDMYEALEALAKIVTGRKTKDLSANLEQFIKKLNVSEEFKPLIKSYVLFANNYRHGSESLEGKRTIPKHEVESFIYLTGLFIRLAKEASA